jgi:hypothetical protein
MILDIYHYRLKKEGSNDRFVRKSVKLKREKEAAISKKKSKCC